MGKVNEGNATDTTESEVDRYNAEITARWGPGVVGGQNADQQEAVSNSVQENALIRQANDVAQTANQPIIAKNNQNAKAWYTTVDNNNQAVAATKQSYQNTLTASDAGGNSTAGTIQELQTSGGFTPAQATQLANWYQQQIDAQTPAATINAQLWQQPAVKDRYPAIADMQAKGIPPIGITDYIAVEKAAYGMASALGLPSSAVSKDALTSAIVNQVPVSGSSDSIEGRLMQAHDWASKSMSGNPQAMAYLQQNYGVGKSDLINYALTNDEGIFGNKLTASSIAGNLQKSGFTAVDKNQVLGLAAGGVGQDLTNAETTAGSEVGMTGATGNRLTGTGLTQAELIAASLGGTTPTGETGGAATENLRRAQAGAAARFSGGGGYGTSGSSTSGYASE